MKLMFKLCWRVIIINTKNKKASENLKIHLCLKKMKIDSNSVALYTSNASIFVLVPTHAAVSQNVPDSKKRAAVSQK